MSDDDNILLDHARRYFRQAGQGTDMKKMKLLAELGLEFLRLANSADKRGSADTTRDSPGAAAGPTTDEPPKRG